MKVDEETRKKSRAKRLIFDMRRTDLCGLSLYPEDHKEAWYFNIGHADVENRLTWEQVRPILEARRPDAHWLCHNAPFELTVFANVVGYELTRVVCTMQLSVTAFGDDNYPLSLFRSTGLAGIGRMVNPLITCALRGGQVEEGKRFNREVEEIIGKITSKTADSEHSYNGWVDEIAYGHGLKNLVKRFFGYTMTTFDEVIGDRAHMGELTGEEVASYGAEDAYWVVPLFRELMGHVATNSPDALGTFFDQENPMIHVYSELWRGGMRVNGENIEARRHQERAEYARLLRDLRAALRGVGDFDAEPNAELLRREKWYTNGCARYRAKIQAFIEMEDQADDYAECFQVSSAVSNAWAAERGVHRSTTDIGRLLSITHYMPMRVLLYDLMNGKLQFDMGKVASDGESRGKLKLWFEKEDPHPSKIEVLTILAAMAGVEQRMKLYLTPYMLMKDPETGRMYPTVNSLLNSRRLAASQPNPMQLAKRGESTYVRGFFLGDDDDRVIVSLDWSAIELVIIGELSKDPEFHKAFAQLPHEDLHTGATVSVLGVEMPWITDEHFKFLKGCSKVSDFLDNYSLTPKDTARLFTNLKGEPLPAEKTRGYWRTEIGKGANFNYWYSGFLHTIGEAMGWSMQTTGEATELYRRRFCVAEEWRLGVIDHARQFGWVQLPDGHRRFRYEATERWVAEFKAKWPENELLDPIVAEITRRINKRAHNQAVNSVVQGTCATIMKRTILRARAKLLEWGWTQQDLARFLIPIHDEKVYSVHWQAVPAFVRAIREIMISHKDLFPTLALEATPAVGMTFEPWHPKKAPTGQVELFEPPAEIVGVERANKPLDDAGIAEVVNYLRRGHGEMRMAA